MTHLECYFLAADSQRDEANDIECATTADAVLIARAAAKQRAGISGFALWHGNRVTMETSERAAIGQEA